MKPEKFEQYLSKLEVDVEFTHMMMASKRILAVSPHPDDMEIAAGGYLSLMVASGSTVRLVVVSDGSKGTTQRGVQERDLAETRKKEQLEAAKILGVSGVEFLGYTDSEVPEPRGIRDRLMGVIRDFSPSLVVTLDPYLPYEAHLDHVHVGKAVMEAVLLHLHPTIGLGTPLSPRPSVALAATANPNVIINIDDSFDVKMRAIRAHESQMDSSGYIVDTIRSLSQVYGRKIGCSHGEPFRYLKGEMLHMDVLAGL
ncbi:MAG: PIG-L deacetylase family protein [Thermoprotei archaeon]